MEHEACGVSKSVSSRSVAMVMSPCRIGRAHRGLPRRPPDGGRTGPAPPSVATAAAVQRRTAGGGYFVFAMQSRVVPHAADRVGCRDWVPRGLPGGVSIPAAKNSRRPPLQDPDRPPSDRPLEGRGRGSFRHGSHRCAPMRSTDWRASLGLIIPIVAGRSSSGTGRRLPGQAARAGPLEGARCPGGADPR